MGEERKGQIYNWWVGAGRGMTINNCWEGFKHLSKIGFACYGAPGKWNGEWGGKGQAEKK